MNRAILVGLAFSGLTACTTDRPRIVLPPAELATCVEEPPAPSLPAVDWSSVEVARPVQRNRDTAMLDYVLSLRSAYGDCAGKVAGLHAWAKSLNN